MVVRYRDGVVPDAPGEGVVAECRQAVESVREHMRGLRVHEALAAAMDLARAANGYVEERQPWAQAKDPEQATALDETLASLVRALVVLTALFQPVAPRKVRELAERLGLEGVPTIREALDLPVAGRTVRKAPPLFPRIEADA